jgi:hypothetical protein
MKNYYLVIIIVAALAIILWNSYPDHGNAVASTETQNVYNRTGEAADVGVTLDLLFSQRAIPRIPLKELFSDPSVKKVEEMPATTQTPTQDQAAENDADRKITVPPRLIGVLIRSSGGRAFFVDDENAYSLSRGDELAGRYRITEITPEKVGLREISTGLSRTIYVKDE